MQRPKKLLSLFLVGIFLFIPLSSCSNKATGNKVPASQITQGLSAEPSQESNPVPTTEPASVSTTEPPEDPIDPPHAATILCDTKEMACTVVYPQAAPTPIDALTQTILAVGKEQTNGKLKLSGRSDAEEATQNEILLGFTNRPESREVMESIGYDDFAIVRKGNKLVVAAHRAERLQEAVAYLCEQLLSVTLSSDQTPVLQYKQDYHFISPDQNSFFDAENRLSDYCIVYYEPSGFMRLEAQSLQAAIKKAYGITLPIVKDSEPEREKEILLGLTNRQASVDYFGGGGKVHRFSYAIATTQNKILIGSPVQDLTFEALKDFQDNYLSNPFSCAPVLKENTLEMSNQISFQEDPARVAGTDLRIMSFNILCELWNELATIPGRDDNIAIALLSYRPDVVGLQEVSDKWYPYLDAQFGEDYVFVDRKTDKNLTNFSPLIYNPQTTTLLDHDVQSFAVGNNPKLRVASWGHFESKANGARYVVINTHWDLSANLSARTSQATEMAELVNTLKAKYNCPVITTGDYNTRASDTQFELYTTNASLFDARLTANTVNRACKTNHTLATPSDLADGEAIDHIFGSSEIEFLFYNVLVDQLLIDASDHYPIYVDINLKNN